MSPAAPPPSDLRSPEALREPYRFFARLREHDPVHWSEASRAWVLTGHEEVSEAFKDAERLSSDRLTGFETRQSPRERAALAETFALLRGWMVFADPPVHGRLRDPVRRVFTPRRVEALAPRIEAIAARLLDGLAGRDEAELMRDFAFPFPASVIGELLGVPPEDRPRLQGWSLKLAGLVFGAVERPDRHAEAREGATEFTSYFEELIRRREKEPGDDLVSALVAARDRGDSLSPDQMVGACTMLLFGGHETTTQLVTNGLGALLERPDELARLRERPEWIDTAVEEMLRFEGPAKVMVRIVARDHERGGHRLRRGERVYLAIAGANRDPRVFDEPDRMDVARSPNPHLGFGVGLHFCLGVALARLETAVALRAWLERFPRLRLARPLAWGGSLIGRGVAEVPLRLA